MSWRYSPLWRPSQNQRSERMGCLGIRYSPKDQSQSHPDDSLEREVCQPEHSTQTENEYEVRLLLRRTENEWQYSAQVASIANEKVKNGKI